MSNSMPISDQIPFESAAPATSRSTERGWAKAWPLNKPANLRLVGGAIALFAIWTAVGLAFMWWLDDGPVGDADRRMSRWLEDHRTDTWNDLTHYGSMMSDTIVKVALIAVVGGLMIAVWRRWHDASLLAVAVIVESSVFVLTSFAVGRDRPPIEQLDAVPPSGSFPSGHTAASVAFYGGLYVVTRWHTTNRAIRAVMLGVGILVPLIVASSRAYRGMHHVIDVSAGAALGVGTLVVVTWALRAGCDELDRRSREGVAVSPDRTRHLSMVGRRATSPMTAPSAPADERIAS